MISRRSFAAGAVAGAALLGAGSALAASPGAGPSAQDIVDRVWKRLADEGVARRAITVDTFKAGNPQTRVRGIATVFMSTWDVLMRAHAAGLNMVITHEPTFWSHQEDPSLYDNLDHALYDRKRRWIEDNDMVVWRIHDHWHARKPDPMRTTYINRLGWGGYETAAGQFVLPPTTLGDLARLIQARLQTRNIRVVGDPGMKVTTVGRGGHLGAPTLAAALTSDVVLVSEGREFDAFEFVRDSNELGIPKGLIMHAHEQGEEYGMQIAQPWFASVAPEVPCQYVPTGETFWIPQQA